MGGPAAGATGVASRILDIAGVSAAEEELGPVDILMNNAGSADTAPFMRSDPALFQRMIDVHLLAVVHTTQALLPGMLCTAPEGAASGQAVVLDGTQR